MFSYKYKPDLVSPDVSIDIKGKLKRTNEVKGVDQTNTPEIHFTKEVYGVENNVEVIAIRDNEGNEINKQIPFSTEYVDDVWKIKPEANWKSNYTYKIKIKDGIEDKAGNRLKEEKELIFTTMFDHTQRNVVMWEGEKKTKVILEPNALKEDGYVLINLDPLRETSQPSLIHIPFSVYPRLSSSTSFRNVINEANEKANSNGDNYTYSLDETLKEILGYNKEGQLMDIENFFNDVYLEIPYRDDNNNGIVDTTEGTLYPVREKTISIYKLDKNHNVWVKVSGTKVDEQKNVAKAKIMGFGTYTLMGASDYDLSEVYAFPVPYKPNDRNALTGTKNYGITFINLSSEGEIKIYTITGELVRKLNYRNVNSTVWYPVVNENGEDVVSGVYIYYIKNKKKHKSGKLVIIK